MSTLSPLPFCAFLTRKVAKQGGGGGRAFVSQFIQVSFYLRQAGDEETDEDGREGERESEGKEREKVHEEEGRPTILRVSTGLNSCVFLCDPSEPPPHHSKQTLRHPLRIQDVVLPVAVHYVGITASSSVESCGK